MKIFGYLLVGGYNGAGLINTDTDTNTNTGVAGYYGIECEFVEYAGGGHYDLLNFVIIWWYSTRGYG